MILVELSDEYGNKHYFCDYRPTNSTGAFLKYREGVVQFDPITLSADSVWGGLVKQAYGTIKFAPDAFGVNGFPPKRMWNAVVKYTKTDRLEDAKIVFAGKIYIKHIDAKYIEYEIIFMDSEETMLSEIIPYSESSMRCCTSICKWELMSNNEYYLTMMGTNLVYLPYHFSKEPKMVLINYSKIPKGIGVGQLEPMTWGLKTDYDKVYLYIRFENSSINPNLQWTRKEKIYGVGSEEVYLSDEIRVYDYSFKWVESSVGGYYLTKATDEDPCVLMPDYIYDERDGMRYEFVTTDEYLVSGPGTWTWNDFDELTYSTIYIKPPIGGVSTLKLYAMINDYVIVYFDDIVASNPIAIGAVEKVEPIRLPDRNYSPTFSKSGLYSATGKITSPSKIASIEPFYGDTKIILKTGCANIPGNTSIKIEGTIHYNGTFRNLAREGQHNYVIINKPYREDYNIPIGIVWEVTDTEPFRVYDNNGSVPILENVRVNTDDTFSLSKQPVLGVRMSGENVMTNTLIKVVQTYKTKLVDSNFILEYENSDSLFDKKTSAWIDSDISAVSFISEICAGFLHCLYIDKPEQKIHLIGMFKDNGSLLLSESKDLLDKTDAGFDIPKLVSHISSTAIDGKTMTEVAAYTFGIKANFPNYFYRKDVLKAMMKKALDLSNRKTFSGVVSFERVDEVVIGRRTTWIDTRYPVPVSVSLRIREIRYDFQKEEIFITGEKADDEAINAEYGWSDVSGTIRVA